MPWPLGCRFPVCCRAALGRSARPEAPEAARSGLVWDVVRRVLDLAPFRYQVASCSGCTSVTLWGRRGARLVLRGHVLPVAGVLFFPLGDRLVTWSEEPAV